jgi:hypothetical protein
VDKVSLMRIPKVLLVGVVFALLQILLISLPNDSFTASSAPAGPTLAQLISYVVASSHLNHGPNVFTSLPSLAQAGGDDASPMIPPQCIAFTTAVTPLPRNATTKCAFGDAKATKTLFLFGDSQAAMWVPAFNIAGEMLHWKIVFLSKDGCGPWISPLTSIEGSSACNQWVRGEIALANQLKPQVVIPVGLTVAVLKDNNYPTADQFEGELQSMVTALAPSHAKILFLQEIPQFYSYFTPATPEACLTVHTSSIQSCELTIKQVKAIGTTIGLRAVASADHIGTVPIRKFFCGNEICDVFVDSPGTTHLVYQDWAHMNATYSSWIGRATAQLLAKYLPG